MNYKTKFYHNPVMLKETLYWLGLKPDGIYVDATLGGGGHSEAILQAVPIRHLYAFDQDMQALIFAEQKLERFLDKVTLIKANFKHLRTMLALKRVKGMDGVLFDLGVSSFQIDDAERGFSYLKNGSLDMRMSEEQEETAADFLNKASLEDITQVLTQYGEEKSAHKIALWIDKQRKEKPFKNTRDLSALVDKHLIANPEYLLKTKSRVFQAIRIHINKELEVLEIALKDAINLLYSKGRIVVISYHSLEDRIVKRTFLQAMKGCECPPKFPHCVCNKKSVLKVLTPKPVTPSVEEITLNSRARSAKLRAAEKI